MRVGWRFITAGNGAPFAHIIIPIIMRGSFVRSLVILMLELAPCQCHLELAQQINQYGCHIFTVRELRSLLQIVSTTSHGIMEDLLAVATPMIWQYLVLMVSSVLTII